MVDDDDSELEVHLTEFEELLASIEGGKQNDELAANSSAGCRHSHALALGTSHTFSEQNIEQLKAKFKQHAGNRQDFGDRMKDLDFFLSQSGDDLVRLLQSKHASGRESAEYQEVILEFSNAMLNWARGEQVDCLGHSIAADDFFDALKNITSFMRGDRMKTSLDDAIKAKLQSDVGHRRDFAARMEDLDLLLSLRLNSLFELLEARCRDSNIRTEYCRLIGKFRFAMRVWVIGNFTNDSWKNAGRDFLDALRRITPFIRDLQK